MKKPLVSMLLPAVSSFLDLKITLAISFSVIVSLKKRSEVARNERYDYYKCFKKGN